jgi:hypothetical protein
LSYRKSFVVVFVAALCLAASGCTSYLSKEVRAAKFTEARPPSTDLEPGMIVTILSDGSSGVSFWRTCTRQAAIGDVKAADSTGAESSRKRHLESSLKLDAKYLEQLKGGVQQSTFETCRLS